VIEMDYQKLQEEASEVLKVLGQKIKAEIVMESDEGAAIQIGGENGELAKLVDSYTQLYATVMKG